MSKDKYMHARLYNAKTGLTGVTETDIKPKRSKWRRMSDLKCKTDKELRKREAHARTQLNMWFERTEATCRELRKRGLPVSSIVPNPNVSQRVKTCATCEAEAKQSKWQRVLDALLS